jgi:magnesium-protoporphyrin IX monomethyl ester (oxidative) cyclase
MAPVTATIETARDANEKAIQSTLLNPRFYTTDFAAMDRIDVNPVRKEWDLMMQEYEGDNNHDHFQRDAAFADEVALLMPQLSPEMRQECRAVFCTTRSASMSPTQTSNN